MEEQLFVEDTTPGLERLHELRLTALLRDVVKQKGRMDAAKILGVNYKTLAAALASGQLTPRLCDALERQLMIRKFAALEEVRESVRVLVERVDDLGRLAAEIQGGVGELRQGIDDEFGSMKKQQAQGFDKLSIQLDGMAASQGGMAAPVLTGTDMTWPRGTQPRQVFRRTHPSVVVMEPQEGDEAVYGDAWTPVQEWRELRLSQPYEGSGVDWLEREIRLRQLEVVLIGEHELTIPPDTDPWDGLGRKTQVDWRNKTLERLRKEFFWARVRRLLRRILTANLWRG